MKILIINYTDAGGGAAVGAYRLCEALNRNGHQATLGVIQKQTNSSFVENFSKKRTFSQKVYGRLMRLFQTFLFNHFFTANFIFHSLNLFSLIDVDKINEGDWDVVNLHWVCNNTITPKDISRIKKPVVWTMHDSWPACGAEHHPDVLEKDERYKHVYSKKNKPSTTKGFDLCKLAWKNKYKFLHEFPISFTAPSKWEAKVLENSSLFGHRKCNVIPNLIDQNVFSQISLDDKNTLRRIFGLDEKKRTLCFGAAWVTSNSKSLKGEPLLFEALKMLPDKEKYQIVVFGPADSRVEELLGIDTFFIGYQSTPEVLSKFYAMSDVFVCPSIIESMSFTCLESICCGLAVVAFDQGGVPDIVEHKFNGYLAECYKSEDLKNGIEYCFNHLDELQANSLIKAKRDFNSDKTVQKFVEFFSDSIVK